MVESTQGQTIAAVERAVDVLTLFTRTDRDSLGVTEISQALDLSKAVVHRILASFRGKGYVDLDPETRRYSLGREALSLGLTYLDRIDVRRVARPAMQALVAATDETATLSVRVGHTRVYVDQVTPARDIRMVVQLGRPFPLHAGGSSKAFLAFLPEPEREAYLAGDLPALTELTVTDAGMLRAELATIRERGYAVSYGERQAGAGSVAAPILDHEGDVVAVMSVCGPVERFTDEMDDAAKALLPTVAELSSQLGHRAPSAP